MSMSESDLHELVWPERTAVVLQEVQNGVVGEDSAFPELAGAARATGVVPNCIRLAAAARAVGVPVVHATAQNLPGGFGVNRNARLFDIARKVGAENAPGTFSVEPVNGLVGQGDVVLPRFHGLSPMTGGPLDSLLRNGGVDTLVVAGVSLNVAIPNLVFDAVNRSYRVVVVSDAVAGVPQEYGTLVLEHTLLLIATLAGTDEVIEAWSALSQSKAG
jgi:nicotinamidase-related amidase